MISLGESERWVMEIRLLTLVNIAKLHEEIRKCIAEENAYQARTHPAPNDFIQHIRNAQVEILSYSPAQRENMQAGSCHFSGEK